MKILKIASLICLVLLGPSRSAWTENQLIDRVVAVVNDDAITQSELDGFMRPIYEQLKTEFQGEQLQRQLDEIRPKLLNQVIEDRLVYQKAKEKKIEISESELSQEMDMFKKRFGKTNNMEDDLSKEGYTLAKIKERIERQLMVRRLHDMEVRSKVVVSPFEVDEYYNEHAAEFMTKTKIRVRSLTIKKNEQSREKGLTDEDAKQKIEKFRKKILKGEDFAKIAAEHSEDYQAAGGGLSEWIEPGSRIPVIDQVIFSLKKGETSDIIETPMGYHLFRVEERIDGAEKKFDQIREQIRENIFREKATKRFEEWMEQLKRESYISIR